jgi:hypothetical protein
LTSLNRQALTRVGAPHKALSLGTLMHQALAHWTLNPEQDLPNIYLKYANAMMKATEASYRQVVGANMSDSELQPLVEAMTLGLHMSRNYQAYHKSPLPARFEFASSEQKLEIPVPGTPHILTCTLDALVRDDKGRFYILERKTYARTPTLDKLDHNDQFLAYLWAVTQLDVGVVGGILYDGMLKKSTPSKGKSMDDLFMRTTLRRPLEEIEEFGVHLAQEVTEIANNPFLYINRRWEGCYDCGVEDICTAMSRGEDADYIIRSRYTKRVDDREPVDEEVA